MGPQPTPREVTDRLLRGQPAFQVGEDSFARVRQASSREELTADLAHDLRRTVANETTRPKAYRCPYGKPGDLVGGAVRSGRQVKGSDPGTLGFSRDDVHAHKYTGGLKDERLRRK